MRVAVSKRDPNLLVASRKPDQALPEAILIVSVITVVLSLAVGYNLLAALCLYPILFSVIWLSAQYRHLCTLDKEKDELTWLQGGYFGGRFLKREKKRRVSDVKQVEVRKGSARGPNAFQIRLAMSNGEHISLTPYALRFSESLEKAAMVNAFLGLPEGPRIDDKVEHVWI